MNPYYKFLSHVFASEPCNRSYLERTAGGQFRKVIDECISQKLITVSGKNQYGEDLYSITTKGKQIVDHPETK
ncbi:MAG: hypothetical protein IKM59_08165 [Oscillospiraceae bacterium]|nr:hypothetical protein [Oscillospiraceae bacterium]